MFDSGRSFSLKYDLIRPPYQLIIPRIVVSLTYRSTAFFSLYVLTFDYIVMVGRKRESIVENTKNKLRIN